MEILKPLVLFVRGLKNTVGCLQDFRFSFSSVVGYVGMLCGVEVQVGVCRLVCHKLGCALGMLRFIFCSPLQPAAPIAALCASNWRGRVRPLACEIRAAPIVQECPLCGTSALAGAGLGKTAQPEGKNALCTGSRRLTGILQRVVQKLKRT